MEAVALISLVAVALLVWKVMHLSESVESLEMSIRYEMKGIAKLLAELQPKGPVEIPARLDDQTLKEVVPQLYNKIRYAEEDTKNRPEEFSDKDIQKGVDEIISNMAREDAKKREMEYVGTENGGPAGLTRDQAQEILSNLSKRRKSKLK